MTDISVFTQQFQTEDRSWDLTPPDGGFEIGGTLDVAAFTAEDHYPDGFIPSGTVVGLITASSKWGPYDDGASDGTEKAVGHLKASVRIVRANGSKPDAIGAAALVHGVVDRSKLPIASGTSGSIDDNGEADLSLIYYTG